MSITTGKKVFVKYRDRDQLDHDAYIILFHLTGVLTKGKSRAEITTNLVYKIGNPPLSPLT